MQFVREGIEIAYDDAGGPEHEPVVLLHGLGSARSTWGPIVPTLAWRGRVLAFDARPPVRGGTFAPGQGVRRDALSQGTPEPLRRQRPTGPPASVS